MRFRKPYSILLFVILLLSAPSVAHLQDEDFPRDTDSEWSVLTELNRWRIHSGLGPLMRNPDLDALAMQQVSYIAPQVPFTGDVDFHTDAWGDGVVKRAGYYGWPGYDDDPNKVLVSEIAAYFPSVRGAINFWQHSKPHHDAVETSGFREAGVAVLRSGNWLISYVVLGGRPDVLPVMYDAARNMLYLSTDRSYFAEPFDPLYIKLLDSDGNRLHQDDWLVWSEHINLPAGAPTNLTIVVSDGLREITTQVDLSQVRVFPSDPVPTRPAATTLSTFTPIVVSADEVSAIASAPSAVRPVAVDGAFEVKMVYSVTSFALINQTAHSLDLSKLRIAADVIDFSRTAQWLGRYSGVPLTSFPSTWCMQVWSYRLYAGPPALPDGCTMMASGRSLLKPGDRFWLANRFDIYYGTEAVVTCFRDEHECGFDIPSTVPTT